MKTNPTWLTSFWAILLSAFLTTPAVAVNVAAPDADQLLRAMSAKLAAATSFRFEATREIDPALLEGRDVPEKARVTVTVQRPNKLDAQATSREGTRRFVADGRTLSLLDQKKNHYATIPMRTSLDGLVEKLDQEYGFTPPLAEFAVSDPYAELLGQAHTATYLGRVQQTGGFLGFGGIACYRIGLKGKVADAELWISVDDLLPRKLVATFHRTGRSQVRIAFSKWNLNAPVSAQEFAFTPPKGATKIEVWTTKRMASQGRIASAKNN
jgi:hypothetical protein